MSATGTSALPWTIGVDETLRVFTSSTSGIDADEVERRRRRSGMNRLPEQPARSLWALMPIHVLFVAMFADGPPAVALDPPRPTIMAEPPRDPKARMLTTRRLGVLVFYGAIMATGTLGLLHVGGLDAAHATTLAFTTFVLFQLFNLLNVRSEGRSALNRQIFTNYRLWLAVAVVIGLQVAIVSWAPLRDLFRTVPLTLGEWATAAALASSLVFLDELRKLVGRVWSRSRPAEVTRDEVRHTGSALSPAEQYRP